QVAAVGHGLLRVEEQVQQRLLEHLAIEAYRRQVGGKQANDVDAALFRGWRVELDQFVEDVGEVAGMAFEFADAGEAEKVVGDVNEPFEFAVEALDFGGGAFFARS